MEVRMTISTRLDSYLSQHNVTYQAVSHVHSNSSIGSGISANIPLNHIAKAVLLENHEGRKIMAVLPANNKISMSVLNEELRGSYQLIKEHAVYQLFNDCENGAIPPVGDAYNMPVVCDQLLDSLDNVYMEAGDHQTLLRMDRQNYEDLMANGKHIRFSREVFH